MSSLSILSIFYYLHEFFIIFIIFMNSLLIFYQSFINLLCLYENKLKYQHHHLIHIFYHENKTMRSYKHYNFQFYAICFEYLITFLLNETSTNSLCLILLFIPFAFVTSSSYTALNEYIFDFNPTNSFLFPLNSSFILPITFLLTGSKNFEFNG